MSQCTETVAIGMSGGVDSSVAAALILEQGFRALGLTMAVFNGTPTDKAAGHACYGPGEAEDIKLAKRVAGALGITHHTVDLRTEYREWVLDYVTAEYLRGRTPNPCVRCNPTLKFGFLLERARTANLSFERFATGHYARVGYCAQRGRHVLKRAVDAKKDQSYFLYGLPAALLPKLVFPLGELTKAEVRRHAERLDLWVSQRAESQDFLEAGGYTGLFSPDQLRPGPVLDTFGNRLGTHRGIAHYTIGQRRGVGVCGRERLHVLQIDAGQNAVVVARPDALRSSTLTASSVNYVSLAPPEQPLQVQAKIRQSQHAGSAKLVPLEPSRVKIVFDRPQWAITPGQSVVFYDGDVLLGGGIIDSPPAG
jgi:tRNA-specific 2-thiouridylase